MRHGRIDSDNIRELAGTTPVNGQAFLHNGTKNYWGTAASGSSTGVETLHLGECTEAQNPFDGAFIWAGIIIPLSTVTVSTLKVWCTQTGSGNYTMGIYDSSFSKVAETGTLTTSATGLQSGSLTSSYELTKGTVYYLAIGGAINGVAFLGANTRYQSNTPYIAKEDLNASSLPSSFSGGSSAARRIWIGAYN